MSRFRFTISDLMVVVLLAGIIAASTEHSILAIGIATSGLLTLGLLCTGILGIIYLRGAARGYWAGVVLFGWIYLGLLFLLILNGVFSYGDLLLLMLGAMPFGLLGGSIGKRFAARQDRGDL